MANAVKRCSLTCLQTAIDGLVLDKAGNLCGTSSDGGDLSCGFSGCGTVFKLTP
jgi:hypothetical protein